MICVFHAMHSSIILPIQKQAMLKLLLHQELELQNLEKYLVIFVKKSTREQTYTSFFFETHSHIYTNTHLHTFQTNLIVKGYTCVSYNHARTTFQTSLISDLLLWYMYYGQTVILFFFLKHPVSGFISYLGYCYLNSLKKFAVYKYQFQYGSVIYKFNLQVLDITH